MKILTRAAREQKGMSLEELSRKTSISETILSQIDDQSTSPTLDQMELIARALDTTISKLVESDHY